MEERYFLWDDGDGHEYAVPVRLNKKIDWLSDNEWSDEWDRRFQEIENDLIRVEGCLTFTNPKTDCNY